MSEQRMKDYFRVVGAITGCENCLINFQSAFGALEEAKVEIFDDSSRRDAFVELVQLDTDTTLTELQAMYNKYKTINDWVEANKTSSP